MLYLLLWRLLAIAATAAAPGAVELFLFADFDWAGGEASCKLAVPCQRPGNGHVLVWIIRHKARGCPPYVACIRAGDCPQDVKQGWDEHLNLAS